MLPLKLSVLIQLSLSIIFSIQWACQAQTNNSNKNNWYVSFPQGKSKALILSYDDGLIQDKRMVELLDKYGLKGTFNINSGKLGKTENWLKNMTGKNAVYLKQDEVQLVYKNHEVASHTVSHPDLVGKTEKFIFNEVNTDIQNIEKLIDYSITSFAYPFGTSNNEVVEALSKTQLKNARTIENTFKFSLPDNFLLWNPTCHHKNAYKYVNDFKNTPDTLALFFIWGHSWEFDYNIEHNSWEYFEKLCQKLSGDDNVWYVGAGELSEYILASRLVKEESGTIHNFSSIPIFIMYINQVVLIEPKGSFKP